MRCRPVAIERGEPTRQHQVDRADVDAQLQRRGGDHQLEVAFLQPPLGLVPPLARQAAVVRGDHALAQPFAQVVRHALDQAARVHEHQRRLVRARHVGDAVVDLAPLLVGAHRAELVVQDLDPQVELAPLADVDDRRRRPRRAAQQPPATAERPHRRRQADPLQLAAGRRHQRVEPLERQRQVRAALVGGDGVDLVDDHRAHVAQRAPPRLRRQQDVERLGRGHQHVRRPLHRLAPLARGGVAGAHRRADRRRRQAQLGRDRAQLAQRLLQVAPDVVRQRLERRDVQDLRPILERRRRPLSIASAISRSRHDRNAASVLPEPVGAVTSTSRPSAMSGHAWVCAGVGAPKRRANQVSTTG